MTKNRNQAPEVGALQNISLVQPEIHIAKSGLPIHIIREVPNAIFHVHIEFGAGKMQQNKPEDVKMLQFKLCIATRSHPTPP
jgi:hypothetical protein